MSFFFPSPLFSVSSPSQKKPHQTMAKVTKYLLDFVVASKTLSECSNDFPTMCSHSRVLSWVVVDKVGNALSYIICVVCSPHVCIR